MHGTLFGGRLGLKPIRNIVVGAAVAAELTGLVAAGAHFGPARLINGHLPLNETQHGQIHEALARPSLSLKERATLDRIDRNGRHGWADQKQLEHLTSIKTPALVPWIDIPTTWCGVAFGAMGIIMGPQLLREALERRKRKANP